MTPEDNANQPAEVTMSGATFDYLLMFAFGVLCFLLGCIVTAFAYTHAGGYFPVSS